MEVFLLILRGDHVVILKLLTNLWTIFNEHTYRIKEH